jgi:3,4-dihydroxy 2-butanone 4-phosphate synthase/GTP cyclohydrolase II
MKPSPIPEILDDLRAGRMVILVDDPSRENEGDITMLAEHVTPEHVNFMVREARGLICMPMSGEVCDRLGLRPQVERNTSRMGTAFTISIEAATGVTTGISAADRARTIRMASDPAARPEDLATPGHIFPCGPATAASSCAGARPSIVGLARLAAPGSTRGGLRDHEG